MKKRKAKPVWNSGTQRFEDKVTGAPTDAAIDKALVEADKALAEAHKVCSRHIHCGTVFGATKHSPLELDVGKALVRAYYRGKNSR